MTTVSEVMTRGARTITPQDQATLAAQLMDQMDVGSLPVCEAGKPAADVSREGGKPKERLS